VKEQPALRYENDVEDALDRFDVPAAILCAYCGQADCEGCLADGDHSGVVAIVPWERAGGLWTRLWSTATLTTTSAESFFAALPSGQLGSALRFAVLAELLAISTIAAVVAGLVAALLPELTYHAVLDPALRLAVLRGLALGIPGFTLWMVGAHCLHGWALDRGARLNGGARRSRQAIRFGLYACGWDLMASPVGAVATLFTKGLSATAALVGLAVRAPREACRSLLRGVYGLDEPSAARARRTASRWAAAIAGVSGLGTVMLLWLL